MSDPYIENVSLLLHFDGADGSTTYTDSSSYGPRAFNNAFGAHNSITNPKWGTASYVSTPSVGYMYLFGGGDVLPTELQIVPGQDFTIEGWFYKNGISGTEGCTIFAIADNTNALCEIFVNQHSAGNVQVQLLDTGFATLFSPPRLLDGIANICNAVYHHIALVRAGTTYTLYVDGVRVDTDTSSATMAHPGGRASVGGTVTDATRHRGVDCYIDEVRFTNGVARYTGASFTPPTGPFDDPGALTCDAALATRSAILHFDGADLATTFADSSLNALTLTSVGGAALTTASPKFGTASLKAANSKSVTSPIVASGPLDLSTGDWTIEGWFWQDVAASEIVLGIGTYPTVGLYLQTVSSGQLLSVNVQSPAVSCNSGSGVYVTAGWNSFAIQRSGNTISVACNGVFGPSQSMSGSLALTGNLSIGGYAGSYLNGKLDDIRITKGSAVHLPVYAPYAFAFPDTFCGTPGGTVYGKFVDGSHAFAPIQSANLGNAKPRMFQPFDNETIKVPK